MFDEAPRSPAIAHVADAIVVLGCRVLASGALSKPGAARTARAARAFREGVAPWIVASGGRRWGAHVEATRMRVDLVARGVPRQAVREELLSLSTFENAVFTSAALERAGARRVALVTCAWHMRRAIESFRAFGLDVLAMPADVAAAGAATLATRRVHEASSGRLDAARRARSASLREIARHFAAGSSRGCP
jgi:uncharacterized SAM-binding protein YcdF (DUF218 family)